VKRLLPLAVIVGLLILAACAKNGGAGSDGDLGTIRGSVLLGPTCPVESIASPCPEQPLSGIEVRALDDQGDVAASALSGDDGTFVIDVQAGTYTLMASIEDDPARSAKPTNVHVVSGETVHADVLVDSGIR
jgi:hypothetical protein